MHKDNKWLSKIHYLDASLIGILTSFHKDNELLNNFSRYISDISYSF